MTTKNVMPTDGMLPLNASLMIQVRAHQDAVPVEQFLRAARELVLVAAEVGRTLAGSSPEGATMHDASTDSTGTNGSAAEADASWRIIRAESSANVGDPTDVTGLVDLGNTSGQSIALVIAPPSSQRNAVQQVREGVRSIHARNPQRPDGFTDAALRALRRAAYLSNPKLRITLSSGQGEGEAVPLDAALVAQIDSWLAGQRNAIGSVEGKLEVISVHNRLRFTLYSARGERIECLFHETLLPQVKSALGERVCIRGRVHYRKDGVPATVEAQRLHLMRPRPMAAL